jgi:hypothetical protein
MRHQVLMRLASCCPFLSALKALKMKHIVVRADVKKPPEILDESVELIRLEAALAVSRYDCGNNIGDSTRVELAQGQAVLIIVDCQSLSDWEPARSSIVLRHSRLSSGP